MYCEVINLSTGKEISIKDTIKIISEILNVKFDVIQEEERIRPNNSEVNRLCGSNKKLKKILNWKPVYVGKKNV